MAENLNQVYRDKSLNEKTDNIHTGLKELNI